MNSATSAAAPIAITGATGFVGRAVLDEAAARGLKLRALTRREQAPRAGVEWVRGDLADVAALERLVDGASAVLHIAGVVSAPDSEAFIEGNVRGTGRLVAAMRKAARGGAAARLVLVSSLAAREPGLSTYGRSKAEGEALVEGSGLDWTIVRPPAVYGPRDTELLELFRAARWGVVPVPADGRLSLIHVEDLARLLIALLPGGSGISGALFEPDDGRPGGWDHAEFARAIGDAVGRRAFVARIPPGLLTPLARLDRVIRRDKARLTPDRARYIAHPDWVSGAGAKVPEQLWSPRIATPQGLSQTAAWYRENHWL